MQDVQAVFLRIQDNKKKLKDLKASYKEALKNSQEYVLAIDELKTMRERVKKIEAMIKENFSGEFTQMEDIKIDIASDEELLGDIVISQIMKGQSVGVKDQDEFEYEPTFKVNFKKVK